MCNTPPSSSKVKGGSIVIPKGNSGMLIRFWFFTLINSLPEVYSIEVQARLSGRCIGVGCVARLEGENALKVKNIIIIYCILITLLSFTFITI